MTWLGEKFRLTSCASSGGCAAKIGPGDLARMMAPLRAFTEGAGRNSAVLVGPETADDAGVFLFEGKGLIATVDFITPLCDDPARFGRIAATNAISDVYAMGGKPLFALNICCFPTADVPDGVLGEILAGAAAAAADAGCAILGGHSVRDSELKFGLAVIGVADPNRLLTNAAARPGDILLLSKPLGTGASINAFKNGKIDAATLEPVMREMERLNARASEIAVAHGARAATDVTGFGLVGHALGMARASNVTIEIDLAGAAVHESFARAVELGVSTGSTKANRANATAVAGAFVTRRQLSKYEDELLFDPQTSGGLLIAFDTSENADLALAELLSSGHRAARIGRVAEAGAFEGAVPRVEIL